MEQISDKGECLVIVNPNAGSGRGKKDWNKISSLLEKEGIVFSVKFTDKKEDAITLTRNGIESGYRKIITVGGDGTLNEVVNGVLLNTTCPPVEISLGLIPVGTGNDWGKMFGIPSDYQKAVEIIREGKEMIHDAGIVSYSSDEGIKTRYFINIAGLGFESAVVKRTNFQKDHGHSGKLIYFYNLLLSLLAYRNTKTEIEIDCEKVIVNLFSLNIGNGRYCGGGMRQTPDALPDDGLLDVTVIGDIGKTEIIRKLHLLYDGTILSHPKISGFRARKIKVTSGSDIWVEADGESLGHTPAEFGILPSAIMIIYGNRLI
jgi:diacylglycerol kinase (ATP)